MAQAPISRHVEPQETCSTDSGAPGEEKHDVELQSERDALLRRTELIISNVLRGGVLLSAGVIALGAILYYVRWLGTGGKASEGAFPHTLAAVGNGLSHGDPLAVIVLGLLLLLATPVLRVAVSIITFAMERDWLYTGITLLVLAILVLSFLLGKAGV
jgi:uncharacterized membrane protein